LSLSSLVYEFYIAVPWPSPAAWHLPVSALPTPAPPEPPSLLLVLPLLTLVVGEPTRSVSAGAT